MDEVKDVDIDSSGKFKYILIDVVDPGSDVQKTIVRGYKSCGFHADIFDMVTPDIESKGFKCSCPGGGRIIHNPDAKQIKVFGYSTGFGQANHSKAVEILRMEFDTYDISYTNEGY